MSTEREQAIRQFRMDELEAVMLSVDKWLDYDEDDPQRPNPATRAAEAREVALRTIEALSEKLAKVEAERDQLRRRLDLTFAGD